jgi:inner membrane protein
LLGWPGASQLPISLNTLVEYPHLGRAAPLTQREARKPVCTIWTHAVAGFGIAQVYRPGRRVWLYWTLAAFLPVVPDFDTFWVASYGSTFGHRGFTHSILFALWFAFLTATLSYRALRANLFVLTAVFFAAMASHGVLDAMTRGGEKIPFFWPLADQRYGHWGPIPPQDLAFELPDPRRSRALRAELLWVWLPTAVWVAAVWTYRGIRGRQSREPPTLAMPIR